MSPLNIHIGQNSHSMINETIEFFGGKKYENIPGSLCEATKHFLSKLLSQNEYLNFNLSNEIPYQGLFIVSH